MIVQQSSGDKHWCHPIVSGTHSSTNQIPQIIYSKTKPLPPYHHSNNSRTFYGTFLCAKNKIGQFNKIKDATSNVQKDLETSIKMDILLPPNLD